MNTTTPEQRSRAWPRPRSVLLAVTLASCLPYLTLKILWLSGSTVGIPRHSPLRDGGGLLWAANGLTVAMDATVIVLALALTRPWGRRIPSWLLAVPLWTATGLLGPIVTAFPVQTLYGALAGARESDAGSGSGAPVPSDLLDNWVWTVVYTGFVLQALALGTLFVRYARERWGHILRGRIPAAGAPGAPDGTGRTRALVLTAATAGVCAALLSAAVHGVWLSGSDFGMSAARAEEQDADMRITEAAHLLFAVLAVAGLPPLVLRRCAGLRVRAPLVLAWLGSGALACWGGWLILGSSSGGGGVFPERTPLPVLLTYAVQMLAGLLIAALLARTLTRAAYAPRRTAPPLAAPTAAPSGTLSGIRK